MSAELAGARLKAALGPCRHESVEPVELVVTGERVAMICTAPDCLERLPADWSGDLVAIRTWGQADPIAYRAV